MGYAKESYLPGELAMLMDVDEEVRQLLLDLTHAGWLDAATVSSPEFEADRPYAISEEGQAEMTSALAALTLDADSGLLLRQQEIDDRWARIETTVGINRFLTELVSAARSTHNLRVDGVRTLSQSWGLVPGDRRDGSPEGWRFSNPQREVAETLGKHRDLPIPGHLRQYYPHIVLPVGQRLRLRLPCLPYLPESPQRSPH